MLSQLDLDEVAQAYFLTRTADRPEYTRLLVRAQGKAILPLLRGILTVVDKQRAWTDRLAHAGQDSLLGEDGSRYIWAKTVLEPIIQEAYDVVQRIGLPAKLELCHALRHPDERMCLAAAVVLSMDQSPTREIRDGIQNTLGYMRQGPDQALVFMVLGIIMLRAGDPKWRMLIEGHARSTGYSVEAWIERTTNSALIELHQMR